MPTLHYLSDYDRIQLWKKYRPIIEDMNEKQLRVALILLLDATEVNEAFDTAMAYKRD